MKFFHENCKKLLILVFNVELKNDEFIFQDLKSDVRYRYATVKSVMGSNWNLKRTPKHLLENSWLRLTENALNDGQLFSPYVSIRGGGPMLTNNLTMVPKERVKKLTLRNLMSSRIMTCKFKNH